MPHDYIDQHSKTTEKDWQLREQSPVFLACSPKPTNQMTQSEKRRSEVTQSSGTRFPNTKRKWVNPRYTIRLLNSLHSVSPSTCLSFIGIDSQRSMLQGIPRSAICVQKFDDSLSFAIRTTYRISLRSSSLREPRYPLLKVVQVNFYQSIKISYQSNSNRIIVYWC